MNVMTMNTPPSEKVRKKAAPSTTTSGPAPIARTSCGAKPTPATVISNPTPTPRSSDCLAARRAAAGVCAPVAWATSTVAPMLSEKNADIATMVSPFAAPNPATAAGPSRATSSSRIIPKALCSIFSTIDGQANRRTSRRIAPADGSVAATGAACVERRPAVGTSTRPFTTLFTIADGPSPARRCRSLCPVPLPEYRRVRPREPADDCRRIRV